MALSIRIETTVSSDGSIELHAPEPIPGQRVTVVIEPVPAPDVTPRHGIDIVKDLPGHRAFQTAEEVEHLHSREGRFVGPLTLPTSGPVYLDTNSFTYTVERVDPYRALLDQFWIQIRAVQAVVITSEFDLDGSPCRATQN